MKKRSFVVFFAVLWLGWNYSLQTAYGQPALLPNVKRLIKNNRARHAFWAITVRDSAGKILQEYNSKKLIRPASNMKLLTSAMVLEELGPYFTYKTYLYGIGTRKDDTWNGNIVIRGAGDPSISGRFYDDDRLHVLDEFYNALKTKGITKVNGGLIGNDSYFDAKPYPDGWSWDDLSFYYAVPINALSYNNNTVDLTVYAKGNVGDIPSIEWFPFDTDYVDFVNEQEITPRNASYDEYYNRLLGTNTIILRSSLPQGYVEKEALSIADPPSYFLDTFKKYLKDGGITVNGNLIVDNSVHNWNDAAYHMLGMHTSHPLGELLKQLNKHSDNFYAEMLLKTAAAEHYNTQGTTELGVSLAKNFAASIGIDTDHISVSDGSGMSSTDLISTFDLSSVLVAMRRRPYFKTFKNSLPVAGVDGSLEHRFTHSPLKRRVFAKTGYVSGVRSLSGYLKTKSNKTLIFSIVTNNYTTNTSYIDSIQESILATFYDRY